jgi:hypothetical protein
MEYKYLVMDLDIIPFSTIPLFHIFTIWSFSMGLL